MFFKVFEIAKNKILPTSMKILNSKLQKKKNQIFKAMLNAHSVGD
jgi:hypothetical protein